MLSPAFLAVRQEFFNALAKLKPQLAGFHNFQDLQLSPDGETTIARTIPWYDKRVALLGVAVDALQALEEHDYPDVPVSDVFQAVYDDLVERLRVLAIAHAQFAPIKEVTGGVLTVSKPEKIE